MTNRKKDGWFKPYVLSQGNIEKVVDPVVAGVYILADMGLGQKVLVKHIKSSSNVKSELVKYLGKFQLFMYKPFGKKVNQYVEANKQTTMQFA